jgi:hypothetical protein
MEVVEVKEVTKKEEEGGGGGEGEDYVIERLEDWRIEAGVLQFKVKWRGYDDRTWESNQTHLQGRHCNIYFDGVPYPAVCVEYDRATTEHVFLYDGGSYETINLVKMGTHACNHPDLAKWEFI